MGQLKSLFLLLWITTAVAASAQEELVVFSSNELRERYQVLVSELRCPKCQNQNLADSNSMIAADLRNEVHRLLEDGKSDTEIVDFLVERYGDFVRYRPPFKTTTALLWGLPVIFLLVIILVPALLLRRQRSNATAQLADRERQRLQQLLDKSTGPE